MTDMPAVMVDAAIVAPRAVMQRRMRSHAGLVLGACFLVSIALVAVFAPALAPHDPYAQDLG